MTAEQFCLRWNNHQRTLISAFDGLFENGTLVDCTLAADGQYLEAHKVVLCACSPYLKMLLSQHYNQHPIVILKDVKFTELQAIVEYIYRGEVNVTQEQLSHFLKAAEMLQVSGLTYRYSENQPEAVGAQIVSSKFSVPSSDSERNVRVVKPKKSKKREKVTRVPVTDINNSLIDSLKLLPSKLVLDIPPISPVNYSKDGSVSPKRKKVSNSGEVKSVDSSSSENKNCESATIDASVVTSDPQFVFEVDPMETEFNTQNIKVEEFSDDSYDSDTLIVDEENAAAATAEGKQQEPGPSGVVADGWSLVAQGVGHPEATKDVGTLAAAMALTRSTAALRAITTIDALRERDRPFVCERCGRHYSVSYTLDRHRKYECGVDKQFFCRKCYRPFSRADSMRVHMRNCLAKLNPSTSTSPSDETL